jgi:rod shape determining protein RodA
MLTFGFALYLYLGNQESGVYKSFAPIAYAVSLLLLILTFFFSDTIRGSARWIEIGSFQLQGGEVVKPLLILSFAYFLDHFPPTTLKNIGINLLLFLIPTLLVFKQPDLGTALVLSAIWLAQIFVAGISYWWIAVSGVIAGFGASYLPHVLHDYQLNRLETFIDPFRDPLGAGYNVIQSIIAVGSGGVLGKGLGHGTQSHLRFLPERHTDFIFASLSEELGLIGSLLIIGIIGSIIYRLLTAVTTAKEAESRLILVGIVGYLIFQTCVNIGMNIGIAPVTGVTLPLVSYGGSSVLATAITLGIAASVIRGDRTRPLIEIH